MPEEIEVETKDLQEAIDELHKEHDEREREAKASSWTRYISLSTALLAVFAAVGALQAGSLVNEAMISQLRASDKWAEYQSARQKTHLYTVATFALVDGQDVDRESASKSGKGHWAPKPHAERAKDYEDKIKDEEEKSKDLSKEAKELEKESNSMMKRHEKFAVSVAFIQVAIALSAISALTKIKPVWFVSLLVGGAGLYAFLTGFLGH